jgi:hypothetical protein
MGSSWRMKMTTSSKVAAFHGEWPGERSMPCFAGVPGGRREEMMVIFYGRPVLMVAGLLLIASAAYGQPRQIVSFDAPASSNKFAQQYTKDVGDAPCHQLRISELVRTYSKNAPVIKGVHLKEAWIRGMTDYTDLNGLGTSYVTYVMENGDKIYAFGHFLAHRGTGAGAAVLKNMTELTGTGGTGRFLAIRGIVRAETLSDYTAGSNQNKSEMEYWMEKRLSQYSCCERCGGTRRATCTPSHRT